MTNTNWLSRVLHWIFAVCSVLSAVAAVVICIVMLVDPTLPLGAHFGPVKADFLGQPGTVAMWPDRGNFVFRLSAFRDTVSMTLDQGGGLLTLLKHYGLPMMLLYAVFSAVMFDLLRRLFRNVGRGESFTLQSVQLVQIIGFSLLVFSVVSAIGEHWFMQAVFSYLVQHTAIVVSGSPVHLPQPHITMFPGVHGLALGKPVFLSGLLVLALSEVFRQGLVLKRESDLTI